MKRWPKTSLALGAAIVLAALAKPAPGVDGEKKLAFPVAPGSTPPGGLVQPVLPLPPPEPSAYPLNPPGFADPAAFFGPRRQEMERFWEAQMRAMERQYQAAFEHFNTLRDTALRYQRNLEVWSQGQEERARAQTARRVEIAAEHRERLRERASRPAEEWVARAQAQRQAVLARYRALESSVWR